MNFEDTFHGRPSTIKTYESLYRRHIKPLNFQLEWMNNNEDIILLMIYEWKNKKLSKNTKVSLVRILAQYIKFLGGPSINTHKFIKILGRSEQQKEVVVLSSGEAKCLMDVTKQIKPKFYPILLMALHAGLRRGEIFGLRQGDIDLENKKIKVSHSYDGPTKNGKSRVVPMSSEIFRMFSSSNLLNEAKDRRVFKRYDPNPHLKALCQEAGITIIRFHDLRHTFASLALTSGINPKQVSVWLGHSSVSTTIDLYWNLTNEQANLEFLPE